MKTKLFTLALILFSLTSFGQYSQYRFNGDANDGIGSYDGAVTGASLTTDRFGLNDAAYSFNSTNKDYIAVHPSPNIDGKPFGLSVWFNALPNDTTPMKIIDWYACGFSTCLGDGIYSIGFVNDRLQFAIRTGGWPGAFYLDTSFITTTAYDDNKWHHAVLTFDSTSGDVAIYIDNQVFKSFNRPFGNIAPVPDTISVPMSIGRRDESRVGNSLDHFNGKIDDITIYNEFLSASKVDSLFNVNDTATVPAGIATENLNSMKVFPNPFTNSISVTDLKQKGIIQFSITDLLGAIIMLGENDMSEGQSTMVIENLDFIPEGIYILTISDSNGSRKSIRMVK